MTLWDAGDSTVDQQVQAFLAGDDAQLDQHLVQVDVLGSIAHSQMLHEQGYLTADELAELHGALLDVLADGVAIETGQEDVHTAAEEAVTAKTAAGKKLHTGRSRNDQVLLDTRLHTKQQLITVAHNTVELVEALLDLADGHGDAMMPGYTHMRQAMPTTVQSWLESYAAALLDDLQRLEHAYQLNDQNPLGAAAGYGTTLNIDRERTTELLGFGKTQPNPTYCVSSRGRMELDAVNALSQLMLDLDRFANDLILFSTTEFGFLELPEQFCTGSSIMPQKQNPDVLELVKGKTATVLGHQQTLQTLGKSQHLGYNRDLQQSKKPLLEGLRIAQESTAVLAAMVPDITLDTDAMAAAVDEEAYAAYTANQQVENGVPFREAYRTVKQDKDYGAPEAAELPHEPLDRDTVQEAADAWDERAAALDAAFDKLQDLAADNAGR